MSSVSSPELLFSDRCGGTSCLQATQVQCRGNIGSHEVLVWVLWGNEECEINSVSVSERVERQVWLRYGYLPSHQVLTQGRCRRIINTFVQSKCGRVVLLHLHSLLLHSHSISPTIVSLVTDSLHLDGDKRTRRCVRALRCL